MTRCPRSFLPAFPYDGDSAATWRDGGGGGSVARLPRAAAVRSELGGDVPARPRTAADVSALVGEEELRLHEGEYNAVVDASWVIGKEEGS